MKTNSLTRAGMIIQKVITKCIKASYTVETHVIRIFKDNQILDIMPMGEHYTKDDFERWVERRIETESIKN